MVVERSRLAKSWLRQKKNNNATKKKKKKKLLEHSSKSTGLYTKYDVTLTSW